MRAEHRILTFENSQRTGTRIFSEWIVNERSREDHKSAQRALKQTGNDSGIDLAGAVVQYGARASHHHHERTAAPKILFLQVSLSGREIAIDVDDDELDLSLVFGIQVDGPPRLALGVEASLTIHDDVGRLARNRASLHVVASDQRTILAVAVEVEVG